MKTRQIGKSFALKIICFLMLFGITVFFGCQAGDGDNVNIPKNSSFIPDEDDNPINEPVANNGTFRGLSQEKEDQIRHDYLYNYLSPLAQDYLTIDDIRVEYYFGSFNGYAVVGFMGGTGTKDVVVAGREFWFPRLVQMLVWDSGSRNFCTIHEAYDRKLLSAENVQSMHKQHYCGAFIGLDKETSEYMKLAHYKNLTMDKILELEKEIEENVSAIPLVVRNEKLIMYFGTYNGYIVVNNPNGKNFIRSKPDSKVCNNLE